MNHRHFKLNQVKARIEGRKALYKQFRAVSKEELKEEYGVDWPPTKVVVVDDEDNLTPDALKERSVVVLTKEEAQKVEEQFDKPNTSLLEKVKAKLDDDDFQNTENPLSGMLD
jgi:hypothetical protein